MWPIIWCSNTGSDENLIGFDVLATAMGSVKKALN